MAHLVAKGAQTVMTPEMIAALAVEAEEGYDLSLATGVRVGRPALGKGASPSPRVSFRASPQLYRAAQERATAEGRTISDLARRAIERYVTGEQ